MATDDILAWCQRNQVAELHIFHPVPIDRRMMEFYDRVNWINVDRKRKGLPQLKVKFYGKI
jgi:hypothetical protein